MPSQGPDCGEGSQYRGQLYASYVSTHFGELRAAELGREERAYFDHHFRSVLPGDRQASILDLGCGHGPLLRYLREQGYANIAGIDRSYEQVRLAHQLGLECVKHGDAEEYVRNHREEFDLVFAIDLIEHLTKDELLCLLNSTRHALKPDGRLVIQTVNADGPFFGRIRYGDLTHEQAYTGTSITQALRACGFSNVSVRPVEPAIRGLRSAARWLSWRCTRLLLTTYLVVETGVIRGHILSQNLVAVANP